ncbi:MAG TPA: hypothetical protein DEG71_03575, partial [Clostridiales bacterium]|nr:hypothetical protein [Clostridiales bacterium]
MKERMVVQMVNKYLIDNNIIFGNEIKMGIGIPDISIGVDIPNGTPFLDDYNILKLYDEIMSKKVVSIDDVYGLYNIDKSILKRYLKKLIEERIIEIKG